MPRRAPGEAVGGITRSGHACDWLGEHIWLSLLGPYLEVWAKIKEGASY